MGAPLYDATARGQLVALQFAQDAVAASQTNVQLVTPGETTTPLTTGYIMPRGGEILGISWLLSAAGTAGVFTIGPTIGGTEQATLTQTVGTAASGYQWLTVDKVAPISFVAGNEIGAEITTDGSWDGTTSDLVVTVWVLLDIV